MTTAANGFRYGKCNQRELAAHLAVHRTSMPNIEAKFGLTDFCGAYPWLQVWQRIHQMSPPPTEWVEELKRPLLDLKEIAKRIQRTPDALRDAMREGRLELPPAIVLGPRLRRWRECEVKLLMEGAAMPVLPHLPPEATPSKIARTPPRKPQDDTLDFIASLNAPHVGLPTDEHLRKPTSTNSGNTTIQRLR